MTLINLFQSGFCQRKREKALSRFRDLQDLRLGVKTKEQLKIENGYFTGLKFVPRYDLAKRLA